MANLESFSAGYALVHGVEVFEWRDETAEMDVDLYEGLVDLLGEPIIGFVNGLHYQFEPSTNVLSGQCAVPRSGRGAKMEGSALLVRK